ncbi:MAG: hypothetical protein KC486_31980 [Myxococcales bacterium]|nr:hypothetical protein [Myxococcales bacterium]
MKLKIGGIEFEGTEAELKAVKEIVRDLGDELGDALKPVFEEAEGQELLLTLAQAVLARVRFGGAEEV